MNQIVGLLTVLERAQDGEKAKCQCACGRIVRRSPDRLADDASAGIVSACNHCQRAMPLEYKRQLVKRIRRQAAAIKRTEHDYTGELFGALKVVRDHGPTFQRQAHFVDVKCACGSVEIRNVRNLQRAKRLDLASACRLCNLKWSKFQ